MIWVVVALAVIVLGLAAWAGTGRLGEMAPVVNDRPKGHVPEGPLNQAFLSELRLPRATSGYDAAQVDAYLRAVVAGDAEDLEKAFDIARDGYDMQVVDEVLDRSVEVPEPAIGA